MKNADRPAMPVPLNVGEGFVECGNADGLTKREMMAMHAPEMPGWFGEAWSMKFVGDDRYFTSYEDEFGCPVREKTEAGQSAVYFAWRTYYADHLLTELEATRGNQ